VLASARLLARLRGELLETGRGCTRHYSPARGLFVLVDWHAGPDDYVALLGREAFLDTRPAEAGLVSYLDWRSFRVEFASIAVAARPGSAPGQEEPAAFTRRCIELLTRLRERCGLGPGYLTLLEKRFLRELGRLTLHDRQSQVLQAAGQPSALSAVARGELALFDRTMEGLRHAG
jgi:hypothetical protein